jgi:hypothetical protein
VGDRQDDRGFALLSVLLLLMLITALTGALVVSGNTETFLARNHESAAQAEAAAEAGLNHGIQVVLTKLAAWESEGFASAELAASALLLGPDGLSGTTATDADNGRLDTLGIPAAGLTLAGVLNSRYEVRVMDEDDPARGTVPTNVAAAPISENNDPLVDANERILVRATGYARDNTVVTLEATIGPGAAPAVITNDDLDVSGNASIEGDGGGVHSNGNLSVGGSAAIEQNATASGTAGEQGHTGGMTAGGQPTIPIPEIHAIDYIDNADYILKADGSILQADGDVECAAGDSGCASNRGWSYTGGSPVTWEVANDNANGTFYVEGDVRISSNHNIVITIIAEGSIDISGNSDWTPDTPGLFLVTDGDLDFTGGSDMTVGVEGRILVREQFRLRGNVSLQGQIVAENAEDTHSLLHDTTILGNVVIEYNGTLETLFYTVTGWREVR